jgi:t-SNARE complex subunit (syntaxin)
MSSRWLSDYDRATEKAEEAQTALAERARLQRKGSNTTGATSIASKHVKELGSLILRLEQQLEADSQSYVITSKEADRRASLVQQLKAKHKQASTSLGTGTGNMDSDYHRNALFGSGGGACGAHDDEHTRGMDTHALLQEQDQIMREQDRGLETIHASAQRLKQVGMVIGDELDDQNEMLEELNDGFDNTQRRLTRETQHVVHVSEKAKAGGMFCCIFLLIVAIIVVAAIPK